MKKEVAQLGLDKEKAVKKSLEELYRNALAEINERVLILMSDELTQSKIYRIEYQKALKGHVSAILDNLKNSQYDSISEYLKGCYEDGFLGTLYNLNKSGIPMFLPMIQEQIVDAVMLDSKISEGLYTRLGNDTKVLKKRISSEISRGLSTSMSYADIARNLENQSRMSINNAMNIVQTEGHRIQIRSVLDSGNKARAKGADLVKVWDSTLDSKTRDHHRELDGQVRELDEDFEVDGITVSAPGQFGMPSEDCRCRCALLIKPRWDVTGSFTKRNNETGELLEFKNASDYQEFKQKYWGMVDKSGGSGIIKMGKTKGKVYTQTPPDFSKYKIEEDLKGVEEIKSHIIDTLGINENDVRLDGIRNVSVLKPFIEQVKKIQQQTGFTLPNINAVDLIDGDSCCIAGYKPMENRFYISSRYFNSKEALLDTLKDWSANGILPKQGKSIRYLAEHESAHMRIPDEILNSDEAKEIHKTFLRSKSYNDNGVQIAEFFADSLAIYRMNQTTTDNNVIKVIEYLRKEGVL